MELIDREAQIKRIGYAFDMQDLYLPHEFIAFLEEAKAVDAVEVVRCKDCWKNNDEWGCSYGFKNVPGKDFCGDGERKKE